MLWINGRRQIIFVIVFTIIKHNYMYVSIIYYSFYVL